MSSHKNDEQNPELSKIKKFYAILDGRYGPAICFTSEDLDKHLLNWTVTSQPPFKSFDTLLGAEECLLEHIKNN